MFIAAWGRGAELKQTGTHLEGLLQDVLYFSYPVSAACLPACPIIASGDGVLILCSETTHYWLCTVCVFAQELLFACLPTFMAEEGWGIVLLLTSLLLTRGVDKIQGEMDEPNSPLTGLHGYCSQEMVNLILIGEGAALLAIAPGNRSISYPLVCVQLSGYCP